MIKRKVQRCIKKLQVDPNAADRNSGQIFYIQRGIRTAHQANPAVLGRVGTSAAPAAGCAVGHGDGSSIFSIEGDFLVFHTAVPAIWCGFGHPIVVALEGVALDLYIDGEGRDDYFRNSCVYIQGVNRQIGLQPDNVVGVIQYGTKGPVFLTIRSASFLPPISTTTTATSP